MTLRLPLTRCFVLIASILLAACSQELPAPVEIEPADMCSYCRMAISEKRYAAEFLDKQGEAYKFDDVGCMKCYVQNKQIGQKSATWFVVDYESKQWLRGPQASFVRSDQFKTPMSGGIVALKEKGRAEQLASQTHGAVLTFAEVFDLRPSTFDLRP